MTPPVGSVSQDATHAGEPLSLAHREALAPWLAARSARDGAPEQRLSDASFANLFLFRAAHDWRWQAGDWPCLTGRAYDGARLALPLFDLAAAPVEALRARLAGLDGFGPLSATQAAHLPPVDWSLSTCRDDADYVYPADNFRHYRGRRLQRKRNQEKQLLATHAVDAVPYTPDLAAEAADVLDGWMTDKAKRPGDTDDGPCREALALADVLGLDGTVFRIGGRAVGFVLAEVLGPGVMAMRFAKGLDAHKGLYPHMFRQFCIARPALAWLNFEQDLGLANFRQTKRSYQPAALLEKYRAVPR